MPLKIYTPKIALVDGILSYLLGEVDIPKFAVENLVFCENMGKRSKDI